MIPLIDREKTLFENWIVLICKNVSSIYFCYFAIISPEKRAWPFISPSPDMVYVWRGTISNPRPQEFYRALLTCSLKVDVCMIGKTTVLVICIHKWVKSIVFAVSIKFCDESGQAMFSINIIFILLYSRSRIENVNLLDTRPLCVQSCIFHPYVCYILSILSLPGGCKWLVDCLGFYGCVQ